MVRRYTFGLRRQLRVRPEVALACMRKPTYRALSSPALRSDSLVHHAAHDRHDREITVPNAFGAGA
jgi:hypothetical protein